MVPKGEGVVVESALQDLTALEPLVNVKAMARIVHDMIAPGVDRLPSMDWLRERIQEAHVSLCESAALTTLHDHLRAKGTTFLNELGNASDDW